MRLHLAAALILIGSVGAGAGPTSVVRVGLDAYPTRLDPRFATDVSSFRVTQLAFSGLVKKDRSSSVVPDLASSWETPSPTEYLFHLRKDARFHDGTPVTAEDVAFTFRSILDEATGSPKRGSFTQIDRVEAVDPLTVRFTLKEPFAPFLVNMMVQGIVPRWAADTARFAARPVGAGPFAITKVETDRQVELAANGAYYEGRPRIDRIILTAIPEETVRVLALQKGDLDFVANGVPAELIPRFERDQRYRVVRTPGSNSSYIGLNLKDRYLKDVRVRKALAYATDRKAIIDHLLGGLATPATGILSPDNWAYEPKVTTYPFDPAQAKRLLDAAGWKDPDGDGPGVRFTLLYKTSQSDLGRKIGEILQAQWAKVGVGLTIRSYEWGTFYNDIKTGNFQVYRLEWVGVAEPDHYYYVMHSSMVPPAGANRGFFADAEVDRLLVEGRQSADPKRRREIYSAVQRIAAEQLPSIPLWYQTNVIVMRKEIAGFTPYPAGDFAPFASASWVQR